MDIERELERTIAKYRGREVATFETRIDLLAQDCLDEIRRLKKQISDAALAEPDAVVCPVCGGSGAYQKYDEYDRYHVYACHECEGTGEIARQSVKNDPDVEREAYHEWLNTPDHGQE